jgi:hypothetical protein
MTGIASGGIGRETRGMIGTVTVSGTETGRGKGIGITVTGDTIATTIVREEGDGRKMISVRSPWAGIGIAGHDMIPSLSRSL